MPNTVYHIYPTLPLGKDMTQGLYIYIYIYIYNILNDWVNAKYCLSYLPTPPLGQDMTQGQCFFQSFPSPRLTKAEEPSLPYYLPIAGGRIIVFIPFPRVLVLCEMQSVSSRIWTRVVPCPFPATITITPRAPPSKYCLYIYIKYIRFVNIFSWFLNEPEQIC